MRCQNLAKQENYLEVLKVKRSLKHRGKMDCLAGDQRKKKYQREYFIKNREKIKNRRKKNFEKYPWLKWWVGLKSRCSFDKEYYLKKKIKLLLTKNQIREIWFRDNAFKLKRPSMDRINPDGNYEFSNCRFIELEENIGRSRKNWHRFKSKNKGCMMITYMLSSQC